MGNEILKADSEHDLYCRWSSGVDAPTIVGTREEMAEFLFEDIATVHQSKDPKQSAWIREDVERILADADKYGTSAPQPMGHGWNDDLVYRGHQSGILPRDRLYDFLTYFLENYGDDKEEFDVSLLKPIN